MASAPACKSDVPYNFAAASGRDGLVHGSARPGAKSQRCFNPDDKVTEQEVLEWADYMKGQGVTNVVGLLTKSELETYMRPPAEILNSAGLKAVNIDVEADPAAGTQAVMEQIAAATAAQEKVVVHCWGGGGRAGRLLAAYMVKQYGTSPVDAAAEVVDFAKAQGASRRVDVPALKAALGQ